MSREDEEFLVRFKISFILFMYARESKPSIACMHALVEEREREAFRSTMNSSFG